MGEFFTQVGNILGIVTILAAAVTLVAWLTQQKWRFRAFGTTAFLVVLTSGVWTLAILPSIVRPKVPGAEKFSIVFDRGANRAVIVVAPTITAAALATTLRQAAVDLRSTGRSLAGGGTFLIQARTVVHPRPGVTRVLYVGALERKAGQAQEQEPAITVDEAALAEARRIADKTAKPVK
ncbi:Ycf51 family protein [Gloeobacter morelensis]|uniref:Ycf51 family protein n=1 Tax=Gloeobacter morelensis MG652769 TaxID=2781736 RepID=A0ABY3PSX6_9CYAN|nr:Ycf51 family protein [Gloeobacter morelensis]UFP96853.1 Ycf51 family protein [Gloeobacter morelensis MG652769]